MFWYKKLTIITLLIASFALFAIPKDVNAKPAPGVSGLLSIVPGLGQVANGDTLEGAAWFATSLGLFFSGSSVAGQIGWDIWQYNMYDAYRDAGASGAAQHNVVENYIANFNPLNIIDPIGAPMLALGAISGGKADRLDGIPNSLLLRPFVYGFVGLGEEGLFRGFAFHGLSDLFGSKLVGAGLSSVLFAYFHITNGSADIQPPILLQRIAFGLLWSWQTYLNDNDLRKSIFTHTWWDFLVTRSGEVQGGMIKYKFNF